MKTRIQVRSKIDLTRWTVNLAVILGLLLVVGRAFGDEPVTMAPPVESYPAQTAGAAAGNVSADSVFNWTEVPQNQQVPIRRAVFAQGGYQLYDTEGETIVIPFANQNLYVMKFALSTDGSMYFVNEGSAPVLYVPENGYLENASVAGARWYPFSEKFHPAQPVFLGIAPSWHVFIGMGWYPGMYCYGGYWGETSFVSGGVFLPSVGLFFVIGGHHYYGWDHYRDYVFDHPAPYHVRVVNNYFYERAHHPDGGDRAFHGGRPFAAGHSFGNGRIFHGGYAAGGSHDFNSGSHVFGGGHSAYAHRTFSGGHTFSSGRTFRGAFPTGSSHEGSFQGGHSFGGGSHSTMGHEGGHSFDSGSRSTMGHGGSFHGGETHGSSHASGERR